MSQEQDQIFFRNFTLIVGGIAVMMVVFFIAANFVVDDEEAQVEMRADEVAEITQPVGTVAIEGEEMAETTETMVAEEASAAEAGPAKSGQEVYDGLCANCHGVPAMAAMMPQFGDKDAWTARLEKGMDTLYANAINGYVGDMGMMPAKGGNPALSDDEVKAAVDYILESVQ